MACQVCHDTATLASAEQAKGAALKESQTQWKAWTAKAVECEPCLPARGQTNPSVGSTACQGRGRSVVLRNKKNVLRHLRRLWHELWLGKPQEWSTTSTPELLALPPTPVPKSAPWRVPAKGKQHGGNIAGHCEKRGSAYVSGKEGGLKHKGSRGKQISLPAHAA